MAGIKKVEGWDGPPSYVWDSEGYGEDTPLSSQELSRLQGDGDYEPFSLAPSPSLSSIAQQQASGSPLQVSEADSQIYGDIRGGLDISPEMSAAGRRSLFDKSSQMMIAGLKAGRSLGEVKQDIDRFIAPALRGGGQGYGTYGVSTVWSPTNPTDKLIQELGGRDRVLTGKELGRLGTGQSGINFIWNPSASDLNDTAFTPKILQRIKHGGWKQGLLGLAMPLALGIGLPLALGAIPGIGAAGAAGAAGAGLSGPGSGMWAGVTMAEAESAIAASGGAIGFGGGTGAGLLSSAASFMNSPAGGAVQMAGGVATGNPMSVLTGAMTLAGKPLPAALNMGLNLAGTMLGGGGLFGGGDESQTQTQGNTSLTAQAPATKIAPTKVPEITPFNMETQFEEEKVVMEKAERRERTKAKNRTGRFAMRRTDPFSLSNPFIYIPSLRKLG